MKVLDINRYDKTNITDIFQNLLAVSQMLTLLTESEESIAKEANHNSHKTDTLLSDAEIILNTINSYNGVLFIAKVNGNSVGFSIISENDINGYNIDWLFVKEDYRHKGIGKEIMKQIKDYTKELKKENLTLGVLYDNNKAIGFYRNEGFRTYQYSMSLWLNK